MRLFPSSLLEFRQKGFAALLMRAADEEAAPITVLLEYT